MLDIDERVFPRNLRGGQQFLMTSVGAISVRRAGTGTPLVLMHSNGRSYHEFDRVFDRLAEKFDVIAWDMPGQGDSDLVHHRTSLGAFAAMLEEVLDGLGVDRAFVTGCSIGAFIAAAFAAERPERVLASGLIELQLAGPAWWREAWPMPERMFITTHQTRETLQSRLVAEIDDNEAAQLAADWEKSNARSRMGCLWAVRDFDIEACLAKQSRPTLIVYGTESPVLGGRGVAEAAVLPEGSRIVDVERAGHFTAIDRPDAFADTLVEFAVECGIDVAHAA